MQIGCVYEIPEFVILGSNVNSFGLGSKRFLSEEGNVLEDLYHNDFGIDGWCCANNGDSTGMSDIKYAYAVGTDDGMMHLVIGHFERMPYNWRKL